MFPVINKSSIEQGILRWEKVLNATGYHVSINDVIYETNETSYDLSNIILDNYQIKVKAIGDAVTYRDSEYSELLELSPSNMYILSIDDSVTDIITTNISVSSDKKLFTVLHLIFLMNPLILRLQKKTLILNQSFLKTGFMIFILKTDIY